MTHTKTNRIVQAFNRAEANEISSGMRQRELRDVLGSFATGVVVATTLGDGGAPVGLTVNSFNAVSLEPPLILWSLSLMAPSLSAFRNHGAFAINILSEDQTWICRRFSRPAPDKFAGIDWSPGYQGVPRISGVLARFECSIWRQYEGGDHEIFIGKVEQLSASDRAPLVFHRGRFARLTDLD